MVRFRLAGRLVAVYAGLALLSGAESFTATREAGAAHQKHERAWRMFRARDGQALTPAGRDYNLEAYARRPLVLGVIAGTRAVTGLPWGYAFQAVRLVLIFAAYLLFHRWLRTFFSDETALLGSLFLAASLPLTFVANWWEVATDIPELVVFTAGLLCIHLGHAGGLFAVSLLGTLNRDTTGLLIPIAALTAGMGEPLRTWRPTLAALMGWLCSVSLLAWWLHLGSVSGMYADRVARLAGTNVPHNVAGLGAVGSGNPYNNYLFPVILFGALWVLPLLAWADLPPVLRAGFVAAPALVLVSFLLGRLNEPRQLIPLYPILVPAAVFALAARRHVPE